MEKLPSNIQLYIANAHSSPPILSEAQVFKKILKSKKPNSKVPGDLEPKLVKTFPEILAPPVTRIFNAICRTAAYPKCWKVEHQIPIPKVDNPETEDQLRNIAKTPFFSKVFESIVADWLITHIKPYLDPNQCGMKGLSTTHYLIRFLHYIHSALDQKKPHAVLAAYVDLSKAFNRVDSILVIQDLYDMHTPPWLLRIVSSYLTGRSMILTYNGAMSSEFVLPGGIPQGAVLGGLIFMIKFNGALLRPQIPRPIKYDSKSCTGKYVDDAYAAASIDMKATLVQDLSVRPKPLQFHQRTGHILPKT